MYPLEDSFRPSQRLHTEESDTFFHFEGEQSSAGYSGFLEEDLCPTPSPHSSTILLERSPQSHTRSASSIVLESAEVDIPFPLSAPYPSSLLTEADFVPVKPTPAKKTTLPACMLPHTTPPPTNKTVKGREGADGDMMTMMMDGTTNRERATSTGKGGASTGNIPAGVSPPPGGSQPQRHRPVGSNRSTPPSPSYLTRTTVGSAVYTVADAMDRVAEQCQRRGLQNSALWLSELSLDASRDVLESVIPTGGRSALDTAGASSSSRYRSSSQANNAWPHVTFALDEALFPSQGAATAEVEPPDGWFPTQRGNEQASPENGESSGARGDEFRQRMVRYHRAALALLQNQEYQRCHFLLSRLEQQLKSEVDPSGDGALALPSCLQFIRLYAHYLDGEKIRMMNRSRSTGSLAGGLGGGMAASSIAAGAGGAAGLSSLTGSGWNNPHLRELRSMLHAALNLGTPPAGAADATTRMHTQTSASSSAHPTHTGPTLSPLRFSASSQNTPPPTQSHSRSPPPPPPPSSSQTGEKALSSAAYLMDVASSSRHRPDAYLLWLMGVVLRELQAPSHEFASFLLASLQVNPLFFSAWEDLSKTMTSEADVNAVIRRLSHLRPSFMLEIFTAGARTVLGTLPMSGTAPLANVPLTTSSPAAAEGVLSPTVSSREGGTELLSASSPSPVPNAIFHNAWEVLLEQFPRNAYLLSQLAEAKYYLENNTNQALKIFAALQQQEPFRLEHTPMYSNLLFLKPDPLGLCSLAQKVYRIDPFRSQSNIVVGNYYCSIKEHERSIFHFRRALMIDPTVVTAWTLLGQAYLEHKNIQAALDAFRCAVEMDRRDYRGWYNLGHSYELLSVFHRARYYYGRAAQLRPSDSRMWRAMASCFRKEGQDTSALECLERAEACEEPVYLAAMNSVSSGAPTSSSVYPKNPTPASREYIGILEDLAEYYRASGVQGMNEQKDYASAYRLLHRASVFYHKLFVVLGGGASPFAMRVALRVAETIVLSAQALHLTAPCVDSSIVGSEERHSADTDVEHLLASAEVWIRLLRGEEDLSLDVIAPSGSALQFPPHNGGSRHDDARGYGDEGRERSESGEEDGDEGGDAPRVRLSLGERRDARPKSRREDRRLSAASTHGSNSIAQRIHVLCDVIDDFYTRM